MSKEVDKLVNTIICGDCLEVMAEWPDGVIDCCVTSPPYWGLRDYGTAEWEGGSPPIKLEYYRDLSDGELQTEEDVIDFCKDRKVEPLRFCDHQEPKGKPRKQTSNKGSVGLGYRDICPKCGAKRIDRQLGLEKTPEKYVAKMVEVFREVKRVLKPEGTLWLNLGDSYAGSVGNRNGTESSTLKGGRGGCEADAAVRQEHIKKSFPSLKPKDLCGIPWRVAFALQADGWYLRQDIIWHKPNPMPESVTDRCTKAHEYIFLLSKSPRYYYDADAIREITGNEASWLEYESADGHKMPSGTLTKGVNEGFGAKKDSFTHPAGRNKRSVWTVTTKPYSQAHFATFPPKLIEPCILAGCPKQVCVKCGKARERIVERTRKPTRSGHSQKTQDYNYDTQRHCTEVKTIGWTSCNCNAGFRPGIVFDPFMGSGTVAEVAIRLKRDYAGCELNQEYIDLGRVKAAETGVSVKEQNAGQLALFEG